jgi:ferrochelatase
MGAGIDSVLLIAFGGPEKLEDVRAFLANVTRGRRIPAERLDEVAHHYKLIGGRSPLNELTFRQAAALQTALAQDGTALPVYVGMRNWTPYLHETLGGMAADGMRRALGIIMAPHQSYSSWRQYQDNVAEARARVGPAAPEVTYGPPWFDHPGFIEAMAHRVAQALAGIPVERRRETPLVFTAHSIPTEMAKASPYVEQIAASARLVADRLGQPLWSVAYQSRSGDPRAPWLEPDVVELLRQLKAKGAADAVVVPIGFVCDHVEVLYDLGIEARAVAREIGLGFHRASTVNDHPAFIGMLAEIVREAVRRPPSAVSSEPDNPNPGPRSPTPAA